MYYFGQRIAERSLSYFYMWVYTHVFNRLREKSVIRKGMNGIRREKKEWKEKGKCKLIDMRVCVREGGERPYLYYLEVGFPPMHIWKVIRCLGCDSSSRCTWTRCRLGSADPRGRPTPPVSRSCWSFAGWLIRWILSLSSSASCVEAPFPLTCGPSL